MGKIVKCSNCGGNSDNIEGDNSFVCPYCGIANFLTDVRDVNPGGIKCHNCGRINKEENLYCSKCGTKLQEECPLCKEFHTFDTMFCSKMGRNIKEYRAEMAERKKKKEKELADEKKSVIGEIAGNMILIPSGNFIMGQEGIAEPVHNVSLEEFHINKYNVSNREYCAFLNALGNQIEGNTEWMDITEDKHCGIIWDEREGIFISKEGYEKHPVINISWYGAVSYCNWLSEENSLEKYYGDKHNREIVHMSKNGYRLPFEAEWEYACRGGSETQYYWGNEMDGDYCWYLGNAGAVIHKRGQKKPNKFGLYDIIGNVWEWCNDWQDEDYYKKSPLINPSGPDSGAYRVLRGGSWYHEASLCRSAHRHGLAPDFRYCGMGFRLARNG